MHHRRCLVIAFTLVAGSTTCVFANPNNSPVAGIERRLSETSISMVTHEPIGLIGMLTMLHIQTKCEIYLSLSGNQVTNSFTLPDASTNDLDIVLTNLNGGAALSVNVIKVPAIRVLDCIGRKVGLKWQIRNDGVLIDVPDRKKYWLVLTESLNKGVPVRVQVCPACGATKTIEVSEPSNTVRVCRPP